MGDVVLVDLVAVGAVLVYLVVLVDLGVVFGILVELVDLVVGTFFLLLNLFTHIIS